MFRRGFYGGFSFCFPGFYFGFEYPSEEDQLHELERYKADLEYELKKVNEEIEKIKDRIKKSR
ncbi:MAG: hypothetical protein EF806_04600 [Candidatus Methanoliparum thermophilum]|uniref:DUF5320 domain-containing protein n=1 Tax=Methanoliparum thermophilum TaxID=2491083 RepID=A0A520KS70_METT2|nr:tektin family protein [Candidatus Methanoliparum sp. LAM-1]RZN64615.1 MAG: hypothetical protein EF806_04600 [Candidatus Methanoliparum thermophilum]BDC35763.1 hypothetical protein MTLP_04450 [Candidatus Methanoliparum sp. LAM-1]